MNEAELKNKITTSDWLDITILLVIFVVTLS